MRRRDLARYSRRIRGVRRELAGGSSPRRAVPSGARRDWRPGWGYGRRAGHDLSEHIGNPSDQPGNLAQNGNIASFRSLFVVVSRVGGR